MHHRNEGKHASIGNEYDGESFDRAFDPAPIVVFVSDTQESVCSFVGHRAAAPSDSVFCAGQGLAGSGGSGSQDLGSRRLEHVRTGKRKDNGTERRRCGGIP